jgi:hypothetical protein
VGNTQQEFYAARRSLATAYAKLQARASVHANEAALHPIVRPATDLAAGRVPVFDNR